MSEPTDAQYLGRALAAARSARGLKRMDLKDRSGVSYPYIAEIENGGKYPSQAILTRLAEALEMTAFDLMAEAERIAAAKRGERFTPDALAAYDSTQASSPLGRTDGAGSVGLATRAPDLAHDELVDRMVEQVLSAIEPRVQELLAREVRYAVREELLRQREGR